MPSFTLHELIGPHMSMCIRITGMFIKHRDCRVSPQDLCSWSLCMGILSPFLLCSASDQDLQGAPNFENYYTSFIRLTGHVVITVFTHNRKHKYGHDLSHFFFYPALRSLITLDSCRIIIFVYKKFYIYVFEVIDLHEAAHRRWENKCLSVDPCFHPTQLPNSQSFFLTVN